MTQDELRILLHLRAFVSQIRQGAWIRGWGFNHFGCIYGPPTHPLLVNHNVVTDWLKLDATDIRSWHEYAGVCQRSKHLLRTMDNHLVVHIVHLHLPFGQSVGAAAEPEFVCDQGQDLPVFVLFTSRASTQTHLDRITWQLNT